MFVVSGLFSVVVSVEYFLLECDEVVKCFEKKV